MQLDALGAAAVVSVPAAMAARAAAPLGADSAIVVSLTAVEVRPPLLARRAGTCREMLETVCKQASAERAVLLAPVAQVRRVACNATRGQEWAGEKGGDTPSPA